MLDDTDEAKAAKRLMVVLVYKDGVPGETIAEQDGLSRSTIFYSLDRLENHLLADAQQDESRSGRPPKLSSVQRVEVDTWLDSSPVTPDTMPRN